MRTSAVVELVFEEPPAPRKIVTPRDYVAPESRRPHGARAKYVIERCRCEPCRAEARRWARIRSQKMSRPDEVWVPYVPAARARAHIRELAAAGVGIKTIAKLSGLPHGGLSKLMYGDRSRGQAPSKRIRPETARRILAVSASDATGAQKIPAGPTWKLLDDLIGRGFTKKWIAQQLGATGSGLQIRRTAVRASTAVAVRELHERMVGFEMVKRYRAASELRQLAPSCGGAATYGQYARGCRCTDCTRAARDYQRERRSMARAS